MKIFVGCSSSEDVDKKYIDIAYDLGCKIALNNHTLIFGSSDKGMMGALYRGVKDNDGKVISVYPVQYHGMLSKVKSDEIIEVDSTSDQLKTLVNTGDMTIILPGSYGTLCELFTSIQCKKLQENNKKIYIFNAYGFYDDVVNMINKIYSEKFDTFERTTLYEIITDVDSIL